MKTNFITDSEEIKNGLLDLGLDITEFNMQSFSSEEKRKYIEFYGNDFRKNPIGTGPFKLKKWEENIKMVLQKNESYFVDSETAVVIVATTTTSNVPRSLLVADDQSIVRLTSLRKPKDSVKV